MVYNMVFFEENMDLSSWIPLTSSVTSARDQSDMIRRNDELHSDIRILSINFVTPGFLIYDATDDRVGSLADSLLDDLHLPTFSLPFHIQVHAEINLLLNEWK